MVGHFVGVYGGVHLSEETRKYNSVLSFSFSCAKCHCPTSGTYFLVCVSVHSHTVLTMSVCVHVCVSVRVTHTESQSSTLSCDFSGLTVLLLRDCSILAAVLTSPVAVTATT